MARARLSFENLGSYPSLMQILTGKTKIETAVLRSVLFRILYAFPYLYQHDIALAGSHLMFRIKQTLRKTQNKLQHPLLKFKSWQKAHCNVLIKDKNRLPNFSKFLAFIYLSA